MPKLLYSQRPMTVRSLLIWPALILTFAASPASAKKFTLEELIQISRGNPQLAADAAATAAMQAQVLEAKLNWLPQGSVLSLLAP